MYPFRDALVHIKDMSSSYYITDPSTHFKVGEAVDVWVKFVNGTKVGLQLFEKSNFAPSLLANNSYFGSLKVGDKVNGTVVKTAPNGVYLNVGHPNLAFLHIKRYRMAKSQNGREVWEILPLNTTLEAFIVSVSNDGSRLSLTTYHPDLWERYGVDKETDASYQDRMRLSLQNEIVADRLLSKRSARNDKDDDDKDDIVAGLSEADYEKGEILSIDQIRSFVAQTTGGRKDNSIDSGSTTVLLNDAPMEQQEVKRKKFDPIQQEAEMIMKLTSKDIFKGLAQIKGYVHLQDLKDWGYVGSVMKENNMTISQLKTMMENAGGKHGRLDQDSFCRFMEIFNDAMGLNEVDDRSSSEIIGEYNNIDSNEKSITSSVQKNDSTNVLSNYFDLDSLSSQNSVKESGNDSSLMDIESMINKYLEFSPLEDMKLSVNASKTAGRDMLIRGYSLDKKAHEKLEEKFENTSTISAILFEKICSSKKGASLEDIVKCDYARTLINKGMITVDDVRRLFYDICTVKASNQIPVLNQAQVSCLFEQLANLPNREVNNSPLTMNLSPSLNASSPSMENISTSGSSPKTFDDIFFRILKNKKTTVALKDILKNQEIILDFLLAKQFTNLNAPSNILDLRNSLQKEIKHLIQVSFCKVLLDTPNIDILKSNEAAKDTEVDKEDFISMMESIGNFFFILVSLLIL